jgi:hypothetical protein
MLKYNRNQSEENKFIFKELNDYRIEVNKILISIKRKFNLKSIMEEIYKASIRF